MPEEDPRLANPHPESPLGQRFRDLHPIFALLRKDYPNTLSKITSVDSAMGFLFKVRGDALEFEQVMHARRYGDFNPDAAAFFSSEVTEPEYWMGIFRMLKASRFNDKNEVLNAASKRIAMFSRDGRDLTIREQEDIGNVAREALDAVYQ